ncbi:DUF2442 domain-containing protein [Argonema galeatum A003/A1]|nr:DUF2442 domain-containing protein [Argonema galeatum]MCL1468564.1 DUF2442 domain-containing protein [Argonema galeatum A003/A1]
MCFEDGIEAVVDVSQLIKFSGIFAYLKEVFYFNQVQLNSELGTIVWPNEADLDPDVLYAVITGEAIPNYSSTSCRTSIPHKM